MQWTVSDSPCEPSQSVHKRLKTLQVLARDSVLSCINRSTSPVVAKRGIPDPDDKQECCCGDKESRDVLDFYGKTLASTEELKDKPEEENRGADSNGNGTPFVFCLRGFRQSRIFLSKLSLKGINRFSLWSRLLKSHILSM